MGRRPRSSKPLPSEVRRVQPTGALHVPIKLSFASYRPGERFCLSHCERDEARIFLDCLRMLSQMTWDQVRAQGGRPGNKVGLAYTPYEDHALKTSRPANVGQEFKIAGIRAGGKLRIFGVAVEQVFHVLWFDRNHEVVEG